MLDKENNDDSGRVWQFTLNRALQYSKKLFYAASYSVARTFHVVSDRGGLTAVLI